MSSLVANLAELDLAFSQPCRRCARVLHGRVNFCPYCGGGNQIPMWGDEAANAALGPGRAPADAAEAAPAEAPSIVPGPEVQEVQEVPDGASALGARDEAGKDAELDIAHIVPAAFEWPDELPSAMATVPPGGTASRRRQVLRYASIGLAVVVSVLAVVLAYLHFGRNDEASGSPVLAQPAAPRSTPGRGEAAPVPAEAAPAAQASMVQAPAELPPARAMPAPEPAKPACSEALAALALCPALEAAGSGSGR